MGHVCHTCGKNLSTRQSLQYHQKSRSCTSRVTDEVISALRRTSVNSFDCTHNGIIKSCRPSNRFVGKSIYDLVSASEQFHFSQIHINLLCGGLPLYSFQLSDLANDNNSIKMNTTMYKVERSTEIHVYQSSSFDTCRIRSKSTND